MDTLYLNGFCEKVTGWLVNVQRGLTIVQQVGAMLRYFLTYPKPYSLILTGSDSVQILVTPKLNRRTAKESEKSLSGST